MPPATRLKRHISAADGAGPMKVLNAVLNLLFPPKCPFCQRLLMQEEYNSVMCGKCASRFPYIKRGEDTADARFCDGIVAAARYEGQVREAVRRYKFASRMSYAKQFGEILAEKLREHPELEYDFITWVPVSRKRYRSRGYDQAKLLTREVAREMNIALRPTLKKVRNTPPQSSLGNPAQRRANVTGAYKLRKNADVVGKRILIVDDVVTTASTISECAGVLKSGGAAAVYGAAFARAAGKVAARKTADR